MPSSRSVAPKSTLEEPFDHAEMRKARNLDLQNARDVHIFCKIVARYMDYLRGDPIQNPSFDPEQEAETAKIFTHLIDDDSMWPVVRKLAPEFTETIPDDDTKPIPGAPNYPLRGILESVRARLPREFPCVTEDSVAAFEDELNFRNVKASIEYLAFGIGGPPPTGTNLEPEKEREAKDLTDKAMRIVKYNKDI